MVQLRYCDIYAADFETTVNTNIQEQDKTEVWAGGFADIRDEEFNPIICLSIEDWWNTLVSSVNNKKNIVFFHNTKFDSSFVLHYLLDEGYIMAFNEESHEWLNDKDMPYKSIRTIISTQNDWYEVCVHEEGNKYIYIRDSLKLLPFSLNAIGKEFGKEKLDLDYVKDRHAGEELTDKEEKYFIRDLGILWFALRQFIIKNKHTGMTIGSCCKSEYSRSKEKYDISYYFPNIAKDGHDPYFRRAYHGGLCYMKPDIKDKVIENGCSFDMNSMYPFIMMSDRLFPTGKPHFFKGKLPQHVFKGIKTYFLHFKCKFKIKEGWIPWVRVESSMFFSKNTPLESTCVDYFGYQDVDIVMNAVDWKLFCQSYDIMDLEIIDGAWFWANQGCILFGDYMKKYEEEKKSSTGINRTISKLFLNNLAGKLSAKPERTTRVPYINEEGILAFKNYTEFDASRAWYIPAATYVTAYGRELLLNAINRNFDKFLYCDTDSIHLNTHPANVKGIYVHPTEFGAWKLELDWKYGLFHNTKQYIEHGFKQNNYYDEDGTLIDSKVEDEWKIVCAGMGARSKQLLTANLQRQSIPIHSDAEREFMSKQLTIKDFKAGLSIPSSLMSKRVRGGTLLIPVDFTLL